MNLTSSIQLSAFVLVLLLPLSAEAQDVAAGERMFRQRCLACHTVEPGQNRIGPSLAGIVGRKAGSVPGARYSSGMRDLGVTWDAAQLDAYLANPRGVVANTTMTVSVPNLAERAGIVAYLSSLSTAN